MWRVLLILSTELLVSAEVLTLINKRNVTCVLTEESVYLPLYIASNKENFTEVRRPLTELTNWYEDDWNSTSSKNQSFYPVTDIRWEDFKKVQTGKITLNRASTSFSLCLNGGRLMLSASDDASNIEFILLPKSVSQWTHYVVTENIIWQLTDQAKLKKVWVMSFMPKLLLLPKRKLQVKVQEYDFRYSSEITLNDAKDYLQIDNISNSTSFCVSLFVSIDENCYLDVVLESGDTQHKRIKGFNRNDQLKSWKRIEITSDRYNGTGRLNFFRTRNDHNRVGFWAIDSVHLCRPQIDVATAELSTKAGSSCRTLSMKDDQDGTPCEQVGFLGKKCDLTCERILGEEYPVCENHKICKRNGTCECLWYSQGPDCDRVVDGKSNSSLNFSMNCANYNALRCMNCKKRFFGAQCSEKLPVVVAAPELISLTDNSITVSLNNLEYGLDEAQPEFYLIQYKQNDDTQFRNFSSLIAYKSINGVATITNLSTNDCDYKIRVLLFVGNNFLDEDVPELLTYRKSLEATTPQLDPITGNYSLPLGTTFSLRPIQEQDASTETNETSGNFEDKLFSYFCIFIVVGVLCALLAFCYDRILYLRRKAARVSDPLITDETVLLPLHIYEAPNRNIRMEQLETYLKSVIPGNNLRTEFESVPDEKFHTCRVGLRNENVSKNRDRRFLPYDNSRVVLTDFKSSDYINASYINGYDRPKAYIACQGPKFSTVTDFWRMVWQERVETIIMATNFVEEDGNRNSAEYWSPNVDKSCDFGKFTIKMTKEETYQNYYRRVFEVLCEEQYRTVQHFQLKSASHKTLYPDDILPILKHLRGISRSGLRPIVIHSGFGMNRTGMFIMCDLALQMSEITGIVNFYDLLELMRKQRPHMVNTMECYKLVHLTVLEYLIEKDNPFSKTPNENVSIGHQMNFLERLYWHDEALRVVPQAHKTDEILIDGYTRHSQFLLFGQPEHDQTSQFWKTVLGTNSKHVVSLNPVIHKLWPCQYDDSGATVDISHSDHVQLTSFCSISILLILTSDATTNEILDSRELFFFQLATWEREQLIPETHDILSVLHNVRKTAKGDENPIVVASNSELNHDDLFVILFSVLEKYEKESEIDVCKFLRIMRRTKPDFSIDPLQLQFIYNSISDYLKNFDHYKHIYNTENM